MPRCARPGPTGTPASELALILPRPDLHNARHLARHARRARGHPRVRPFRDRSARRRPVLESESASHRGPGPPTDSGETIYTLNWLPIGGFVGSKGRTATLGDDPRSFVRAPKPITLMILLAGVVDEPAPGVHALLAIFAVADPSATRRSTSPGRLARHRRPGLIGGDRDPVTNDGDRQQRRFDRRSGLDRSPRRTPVTPRRSAIDHAHGRTERRNRRRCAPRGQNRTVAQRGARVRGLGA